MEQMGGEGKFAKIIEVNDIRQPNAGNMRETIRPFTTRGSPAPLDNEDCHWLRRIKYTK
jgi:hypothetical protein